VSEAGCAKVAPELSAWIDGELDAPAAARVREHLAACAPCRRRHALLVAAGSAVRSLPEETVPAGFEDALRRRLAATRAGAGKWRRPAPALVAAAAIAAVVLVAVLGLPVLREASLPLHQPAPSAAAVPRWLAACGASTASECLREMPCASAAACGVGAPGQAEAACASPATCAVLSVVPLASAGRFVEPGGPAPRTPR
jgi:anti-sigma factor RsiW